MEKNAKIYVAGHRGLVGSALIRRLEDQGYTNIVGKSHSELDLTRQKDDMGNYLLTDNNTRYVLNSVESTAGTILPTIGIMLEF